MDPNQLYVITTEEFSRLQSEHGGLFKDEYQKKMVLVPASDGQLYPFEVASRESEEYVMQKNVARHFCGV